jgi:hypothetical protein
MILSDLLGQPVLADNLVGYVTDVRFLVQEGPDGQPGPAHAYGIIVSPHARISRLGYERSRVRSPWPIAALQRRRHRGTVLVRWSDIESISSMAVHLKARYVLHPAELPHPASGSS